jgi:lambda family phage minor tail protein L
MTIDSDIQKLAPGDVIEMYELDATVLGGAVTRYHAGRNGLMAAVVWQGNTFSAVSIEAGGYERNARGTLPRPTIRVGNAGGVIGQLAHSYQDLVDAKVTRKRTLVKYLDAVNFPGSVNATADSNQHWPDEVWFIDRKSLENPSFVEFELSSPWDVAGIGLPRRPVIANICAWIAIGGYRGAYCGYAGGAVALADDTPTSDLGQDRCGGRVSSCKLRFGADGELPFGGEPAAGLIR